MYGRTDSQVQSDNADTGCDGDQLIALTQEFVAPSLSHVPSQGQHESKNCDVNCEIEADRSQVDGAPLIGQANFDAD